MGQTHTRLLMESSQPSSSAAAEAARLKWDTQRAADWKQDWDWDGCMDAGFDKTVLGRKVLGFKEEHPLTQSLAAIFPKDKTPTENPHWVSVIASLFVSQREKIKISAEQNFTSATLINLWCFYWSHFCILALVIILVLTLFACLFIHACFLWCVRQMTPFGVTAASTVLPLFNMMPPCRLSFHNVSA